MSGHGGEGGFVGQSLESLISDRIEQAKSRRIYDKAYEIIKKYGQFSRVKQCHVYKEREKDAEKHLFNKYRQTFAINYDEVSIDDGLMFTRELRIYDGRKLVFRAYAEDIPALSKLTGWSEPEIKSYIPDDKWEEHLNSIYNNGPNWDTKREALKKNFNL